MTEYYQAGGEDPPYTQVATVDYTAYCIVRHPDGEWGSVSCFDEYEKWTVERWMSEYNPVEIAEDAHDSLRDIAEVRVDA